MNAASPPPRIERELAAAIGMEHAMLRIRGVTLATGLSRATIYRMIDRGELPSPVKLSRQNVGWRRLEIDAWLALRQPA